MTSQTEKAKAKLAALDTSFDDLEATLEPLFAQTLPESVLALEPIQQAKLQTVLPYLVYDLIFIYLKTRGIDPKTHPVVPELDRVKEYFNKISLAENPPTRRAEIDKGAAQRFIKQAINQVTYGKTPVEEIPASSSTPLARVQTKITSKMLERQLYEKKLREQDARDSEEDELEVFGGAEDDSMDVDADVTKISKKGKGKAKEIGPSVEDGHTRGTKKRSRPVIDPFAGYGDDVSSPTPAIIDTLNPGTPDRPGKGRALDDVPAADTPTSGFNEGILKPKKAKKAKKKNKNSLT